MHDVDIARVSWTQREPRRWCVGVEDGARARRCGQCEGVVHAAGAWWTLRRERRRGGHCNIEPRELWAMQGCRPRCDIDATRAAGMLWGRRGRCEGVVVDAAGGRVAPPVRGCWRRGGNARASSMTTPGGHGGSGVRAEMRSQTGLPRAGNPANYDFAGTLFCNKSL